MKAEYGLQIRNKHLTAYEEELRHWFTHMIVCADNNTTYKFALARFLLDYSKNIETKHIQKNIQSQTGQIVPYKKIAEAFFDYYLPHVYKYNLKQDHHTKYKVYAIDHIRDTLGKNHDGDLSKSQDKVEKAIKLIERDVFGDIKRKKSQVVPRFQKIKRVGSRSRSDRMFYDYDSDRRMIIIKPEAIKFLNENYSSLYAVTILRWSQYLKKANPNLHSAINLFVDNEKIPISGSIEETLLRYLRDLIPSNSEVNTLQEYCKKSGLNYDGSLFLISTEPEPISKMFSETINMPVDVKIIKYNIPKSIQNRLKVAVLGLDQKYTNMLKNAKEGDVVLFFNKTRFHASSKILAYSNSPKIAKLLWNFTNTVDTKLIFFLSEVENIDMKTDEIMHFFIDTSEKLEFVVRKVDLEKEKNLKKKFGNIENTIRSLDKQSVPLYADVKAGSGIVTIRSGQEKFRQGVLTNFYNKCALCGISDIDLLEAAHILPFKENQHIKKISNGICLCVMHHTMFDKKYFAINGKYQIFITEKNMSIESKNLLQWGSIKKPRIELSSEYLDQSLANFLKHEQ